ncbi:TetR/AcrR family transcriptional regulator [Actinoplanes sp. NBRC 103695]|uniref:TetR/AcrR family transcriptional regulator n=1 Tax=Actinoplanes sp. NBRC 103695 TaxID=3032202 RepID=UPI0024A0C0EC|nr:TetR/AcrR family transcriptional regulator [Actinoplanes sp. NBRC 103695]GLY97784.1 TetR family transcriptional regulator [Actinoplanes sp. NBRC 103695]
MTEARPLRADARRNRDKVLATAVHAFATEGADVSLEAIAKAAGVGIGTLYRHFPTREALVAAAYRNELDRIVGAVPELLAGLPPEAALRAWMDLFVGYMHAKRDLGDALRALIASGGDPFAQSRERLIGAVVDLMAAGVAAGTIRDDVPPLDVLVGLGGITTSADPAQASRLLDLLMDGLRHGTSRPAGPPGGS